MLDRLSSYTGMILWELAWVDLTMFVLGEWLGLEEFEFLVHIILCASCRLGACIHHKKNLHLAVFFRK